MLKRRQIVKKLRKLGAIFIQGKGSHVKVTLNSYTFVLSAKEDQHRSFVKGIEARLGVSLA